MEYIFENKTNLLRRISSTIFDYLIIFIINYAVVRYLGEPLPEGGYHAEGITALIPLLFWFVFFPLSEYLFSKTLGMYFLDLKVVKVDSSQLKLSDTIKRRILDIVDIFLFFGIIAIVVIKNNKLSQRVGDIVAHTIVVYED